MREGRVRVSLGGERSNVAETPAAVRAIAIFCRPVSLGVSEASHSSRGTQPLFDTLNPKGFACCTNQNYFGVAGGTLL